MSAYTDTITIRTPRVVNNDRGNYWRYYGLQRDPFTLTTEDSGFYLPPRWEQYFDLLHYLCDSNNVLLVVTGLKGSGKTTFVRQFITEVNETKQLCQLNGVTTLNTAQLKAALIKNFALLQPVGETLEEQLDNLIAELQAKPQPCLLVIDEAHRLPEETLRTLLHLIKQQSENHMRLHVLLLGDPRLKNVLGYLAEREGDRELVHNLMLEPFTLDETRSYLKHRLTAAGLPSAMPLSQSAIARIYSLSEGIAGRINAVARQTLIDGMQQRQLFTISDFIRARRTQLLGGGVVLIALVCAALMMARGDGRYAVANLHQLWVKHENAAIVSIAAEVPIETNNVPVVVVPTAIVSQQPIATNSVVPQSGQPTPVVNTMPTLAPTHVEPIKTNVMSRDAVTTEVRKGYFTSFVDRFRRHATPGSMAIAANKPEPQAMKPLMSTIPPMTFAAITPQTSTIVKQPQPVVNSVQAPAVAVVQKPIVQVAANALPQTATQPTAKPVFADTMLTQEINKEENISLPATIKQVPTLSAAAMYVPAITVTPQSHWVNRPKAAPAPVQTAPASVLQQQAATTDTTQLLNADPHAYTVQLIAMSSEPMLKKFIAKNQLTGQVNYIRMSRQGKDLYVAIYGQYKTAAEAHAAAKDLPALLQKQTPWVRMIASIEKSAHTYAQTDAVPSEPHMIKKKKVVTAQNKPVHAKAAWPNMSEQPADANGNPAVVE